MSRGGAFFAVRSRPRVSNRVAAVPMAIGAKRVVLQVTERFRVAGAARGGTKA